MIATIRRKASLRDYLFDHAPYYAGVLGAMTICLLIAATAFAIGWPAITMLVLAGLLILLYVLVASLLIARRKLTEPDYEALFVLGQVKPDDRLAQVDVGRREAGIALCRHLTVGKLTVIDLYNPRWTPSPVLARARRRLRTPPGDPRLAWLEGQVDLLPLPDGSQAAVLLDDTLSQFWQAGDRERLLAETLRVLKPGGRLLVAERTRSLSNWLALGPAAGNLHSPSYWRSLIEGAGFLVEVERSRHDLTTCWRAAKPVTDQDYQLAFRFEEAAETRPPTITAR